MLKPAELACQGAEEDAETDNCTQGADGDDNRLASPGSERHLLRNADCDRERILAYRLDGDDARDFAYIARRAVGAAAARNIFVPRRFGRNLLADHLVDMRIPRENHPIVAEQADRLALVCVDGLVEVLKIAGFN